MSRLEDWARESSIWPVTFGLACCAIEMMATGASRFDIARFGAELFRASPRQADLMIVAGRVSQKMAPVLRQIYDQMPEPKWVIAMGDCASCSGVFNNYALIQGVDKSCRWTCTCPAARPARSAARLADQAQGAHRRDSRTRARRADRVRAGIVRDGMPATATACPRSTRSERRFTMPTDRRRRGRHLDGRGARSELLVATVFRGELGYSRFVDLTVVDRLGGRIASNSCTSSTRWTQRPGCA